jgi:hypothetical protein
MNNSKEYNDEPVFYCKSCLSLKIKTVASGALGLDYCDDCGSTDVETTDIESWRQLYRERYGFDYLTKEIYNGREQNNRDKEV